MWYRITGMRWTLIYLPPFAAQWLRMGLNDDDLRALENAVMDHPTQPVVPGTGGLRKTRFAPPSWHTGKSGATRVCYAIFPEFQRIYFVDIYGKNEKADLSAKQKKIIRTLLQKLADEIRGNRKK